MRLSLLTAPVELPVSVAEAKAHLRVDHNREDAYIASAIQAATSHAQAFTRRQFVTATWALTLDQFPVQEIRLPLAPLRSARVAYVDPSLSSVEWDVAEYVVDAHKGEFALPGRIHPKRGRSFPTTHPDYPGAVVPFEAGYGAAADVPAAIKHAILLTVGDLFENRATSVIGSPVSPLTMTSERLLWPYRVLAFS
jgi:uncharacterized phiE125 gp8 family phage protein